MFKQPFCPNDWLQIKQMNGFLFSWTVWTCLFKTFFCPNDSLQIKHVNGFLFSWTAWTCPFKTLLCPNDCLLIIQLNCLTFSWTVCTCILKFPFWLKDLLQIKQVNGFFFSWTDLTWMLKDDFCPNDLLQTGQSKTCFSSVCSILCPCKQFFSAYVNLQYDEICVRMQPASSHHPASLTCSICWWELFNFQTNANLNQISEITICFDDRTITLCAVVGNTGWHGMAKSER